MYERVGDHLQAEFDRILVALNGFTDRDLRPESDAIDVPESATAGTDGKADLLTNVGTTLRSISGETEGESVQSAAESSDELQKTLTELTAVIERNRERARKAGLELRLDALARSLDLSRTHLDALVLALAPEFDWRIASLYGSLSGMNQPLPPQITVLETILGRMGLGGATDGVTPKEALASTSPLFEFGVLVRHFGNPGTPSAYDTVTVDERIVDYLKGDDSLDRALANLVTIDQPNRTLSDLVFDEETTETLETVRDRSAAAEAPTTYHFSGEDGTGKDRLPAALTDAETPVLRASADDIVEDEDLCTRLIREAALRDAAIHLEGLERVTERREEPAIGVDDQNGAAMPVEVDTPSVDAVVERFDDAPGDVFVSHTESWKPDVDLDRHRVETAHCPFPGYETRLAIWTEYADEVGDDYLVENVATNFRLPQRDIRRAVETARYLCRTDADVENLPADAEERAAADAFAPVDGALTREHLYEACKRYSASNLEALADRMEPGYEFDDIYLNDRPKTHLRELCGHLQYRGAVTSEWGFGEPGSRGDGVVALFYGQPGTGKTMAAEILANETGLDLYRVDLAQIVDKYIGETESQLAALLDEAERSNAILLFDEADSLFGERTDVGDATDRHANNVTNFLLQRLESFDGIAVLTTNKRSGIDPAFKRRIAHSIRFDIPQEHIRRRIWRESFPAEANVDTTDFDYEFLGMLSLTPAVIRKVAKYAAYIAATEAHDGRPLAGETASLEDVTITFDHVVLGLQYATEAGGVALQEEFYQYEDRLRTYENQTVSRDFETLFRMRYVSDGEPDDADSVEGSASPPTADGGTGAPASAEGVNDSTDAVTREIPDDLQPEGVVRYFYERVRSRDVDTLGALYHSDAEIDPLSRREVTAMDLNDVAIDGSPERVVDEPDRVVLAFDEDSTAHRLPTEVELRPDDGNWRIVGISQEPPTDDA